MIFLYFQSPNTLFNSATFSDDTLRTFSTFSHSYTIPGSYAVNATAYNLHSDEEYGHVGFTHNFSKIVHVQEPLDQWEATVQTPWLLDDGREEGGRCFLPLAHALLRLCFLFQPSRSCGPILTKNQFRLPTRG